MSSYKEEGSRFSGESALYSKRHYIFTYNIKLLIFI